MIETNLDYLLIGKSYISFIYGIELMKQHKKVLIVDEPRIGYGEMYASHFGELEKAFLKEWGKRNNVATLDNLDLYLRQASTILIFDHLHLRIGASPAENIVELARKLPECFKGSEDLFQTYLRLYPDTTHFNLEFLDFTTRVSAKLLITDSSKLKASDLLSDAPEFFQKLYFNFRQLLENDSFEMLPFRTLVFLLRSYWQEKLSIVADDLELVHLLLTLLSPHYELSSSSINNDLEKLFCSLGGKIKNTSIPEIEFLGKETRAVLLDSYEGIVSPSKIDIFSGPLKPLNFSISSSYKFYQAIKCKVVISSDINPTWRFQKILYSSRKLIGTDTPIVELNPMPGYISCFVMMEQYDGFKAEFVKKKITALISDILRVSASNSDLKFDIENLELSKNVWCRNLKEIISAKQHLDKRFTQATVYEDNFDGVKTKIDAVRYFGPMNLGKMGLISNLLDVKRST